MDMLSSILKHSESPIVSNACQLTTIWHICRVKCRTAPELAQHNHALGQNQQKASSLLLGSCLDCRAVEK